MLNSQGEYLKWGLSQKTWQVGQREGRVRFQRIPRVIDWGWLQIRRVDKVEHWTFADKNGHYEMLPGGGGCVHLETARVWEPITQQGYLWPL